MTTIVRQIFWGSLRRRNLFTEGSRLARLEPQGYTNGFAGVQFDTT
jgi:hypothetical protein